MPNSSRAATIQAETAGQLWAMDRQTFRRILLKSAFRKRKMYETLLDNVPMLKTLQVISYIHISLCLLRIASCTAAQCHASEHRCVCVRGGVRCCFGNNKID